MEEISQYCRCLPHRVIRDYVCASFYAVRVAALRISNGNHKADLNRNRRKTAVVELMVRTVLCLLSFQNMHLPLLHTVTLAGVEFVLCLKELLW